MQTHADVPTFWKPWKVFVPGLFLAGGVVAAIVISSKEPKLVSSPTAVRPWAEEEFLRLTRPVPSAGKPTDPRYQASHGSAGASTLPEYSHYKTAIRITDPAERYVPDFEVIEFNAKEKFQAKAGSGAARWVGTLPNSRVKGGETPPPLQPFFPDGKSISREELSSLGLSAKDLDAWGLEPQGEVGTGFKSFLALENFENLQGKFQGVFDANTHVAVHRGTHLRFVKGGAVFNTPLALLHAAPLVAVIDLAHGPAQEKVLPVEVGAVVKHPDFTLEVVDVVDYRISGTQTKRDGNTTIMRYGDKGVVSKYDQGFSIVYQINPPSMVYSLSLDAVDVSGKELKNNGRFMDELIPISKFEAPLANAVSLKIRYRPHQTRLLIKFDALPGVDPENQAVADLFDAKIRKITLDGTFRMRKALADGAQLKDITGTWTADPPHVFPITLTNVSLREIGERYRALEPRRKIKTHPVDQTIQFERAPKPTWATRMLDWRRWLIP
ncbi:MAG: hypothetical protein QM680_05620 [Luteolibacter sp.]